MTSINIIKDFIDAQTGYPACVYLVNVQDGYFRKIMGKICYGYEYNIAQNVLTYLIKEDEYNLQTAAIKQNIKYLTKFV